MYIPRPGKDLRTLMATWPRTNRKNDGISRHFEKEADEGLSESIYTKKQYHPSHIWLFPRKSQDFK